MSILKYKSSKTKGELAKDQYVQDFDVENKISDIDKFDDLQQYSEAFKEKKRRKEAYDRLLQKIDRK